MTRSEDINRIDELRDQIGGYTASTITILDALLDDLDDYDDSDFTYRTLAVFVTADILRNKIFRDTEEIRQLKNNGRGSESDRSE